jgi:hypothetical protein
MKWPLSFPAALSHVYLKSAVAAAAGGVPFNKIPAQHFG